MNTIIELRYIMSAISENGFIEYVNYWHKQGADEVLIWPLAGNIRNTVTHARGIITSYKKCSLFGKVIVSATGDVTLSCCSYIMESVGNVYKTSFFDIMNSNKVIKYEKAHKELDVNNLPPICINCPNMHVYKEKPTVDTPIYQRYKNLFMEMTKNKKLIIWGAAKEFEIAQRLYTCDSKIAYIVDNDPKLWHSFMNGHEIKPPEVLKNENKENLFVLIASRHFFSIQYQLSAMGIEQYYPTQYFLDRYLERYQNTTIFLQ